MLQGIQIQNFRCFPSLEVELRPLTVLIGANNTGKSAFLDAIRMLGRGSKVAETDFWRLDKTSTLEIGADSDVSQNLQVTATLKEGRINQRGGRHLDRLSYFVLPSKGVKCTDEGFPESEQDLPLGEQGEHLASVLDYLYRMDPERFHRIEAKLRTLIPGFQNLRIATPEPQTRHLKVVLDNGLQLPGETLSVGLRHLIFFVTLAHHPQAPEVILLEEPESGVHPKRLGDIIQLLRSISKGEHCDHPAQVILTTHSPFLLDHLDLDHDQLLIFQRDETNGHGPRAAYAADKEKLQIFLDEFMLGEVWINEGEEGMVAR